MIIKDFERFLGTNKVLDASRRSRTLSGGAEERRLRRIYNTPQACREPQGRRREATEGNTTNDSLMVDHGSARYIVSLQ